MPEDKGFGSKLVGLFIQSDESKDADSTETAVPSKEKSAADVVAELAGNVAPKSNTAPKGAAAAQSASPNGPPSPAVKVDPNAVPAKVDFDAVFKSAGMDASELDRVRKAEELLKSLPDATPHDVKRQIVEASLKAFGVDLSKIAGAADNQLKALDTFVRVNEQQTAKAIADAKAQIQNLDEKIIALKVDIDKKTATLSQTAAAAQIRKAEVNSVLSFFQNAPAPSKIT
jgi:hypothetical protein